MFHGYRVHFLNLPSKKESILAEKISKNGGEISCIEDCNVVVCDNWPKRKLQETSYKVVKSEWISQCLVNQDIPANFLAKKDEKNQVSPVVRVGIQHTDNSKIISVSDSEEPKEKLLKKSKTFACAKPLAPNLNEHLTIPLTKILESHKARGDKFRIIGYQKAISTLARHPKKIECAKEVSDLRGIGKKFNQKIQEILETGMLRRAAEDCEDVKIKKLFMGIWGVGPNTANQWYLKGYRTLSEVEPELNRQQKIGLKYYSEINERMERSEASWIVEQVKSEVLKIDSDLIVEASGSFRRGKDTCGDVDILVTKNQSSFNPSNLLIEQLSEGSDKFMGICKTLKSYRRLDILIVPFSSFYSSLLYFTGSDAFNRSMRLLAKSKGMSLSEHGLYKNVVRKGKDKVAAGIPLKVESEQDIFNYLEMDYKEPHERSL